MRLKLKHITAAFCICFIAILFTSRQNGIQQAVPADTQTDYGFNQSAHGDISAHNGLTSAVLTFNAIAPPTASVPTPVDISSNRTVPNSNPHCPANRIQLFCDTLGRNIFSYFHARPPFHSLSRSADYYIYTLNRLII